MKNVISFIIKYSAFIAFLLLEIISFYFIVNYNKSQKEIWLNSSNIFVGSINKHVQGVEDFFKLQERNDSLLTENARLLETIINYRVSSSNNSFQNFEEQDSTLNYELIPSKICSKTIHLRNNYITLCKGAADGIKSGMGVISNDGIVGIVKEVSEKFSSVLLIINSQSRISVKINSKNYSGNLVWKDEDIRKMNLIDIPKHAEIEKGDTISTSGYSVSFPKDIMIGTISDFQIKGGGNSFEIDVELFSDIGQLDYVYVVNFVNKEEKEEITEVYE